MTLFDLLLDQACSEVSKAADHVSNTSEFKKHIGATEMCTRLIDMLSDETLMTEVVTKAEKLSAESKP